MQASNFNHLHDRFHVKRHENCEQSNVLSTAFEFFLVKMIILLRTMIFI